MPEQWIVDAAKDAETAWENGDQKGYEDIMGAAEHKIDTDAGRSK